MPEFQILGEFVYHCVKCDLDLNHRITLMKGDLPKRVLCLTCQTERAYRSPQSATKRAASSRKMNSGDVVRVRQSHEESEWKLKLTDKSKTPHPYKITLECEIDDHVYHQTFGHGLVVGFVDVNKVQIYFESGVKLLLGKRLPVPMPEKRKAYGTR